MLTPGKRGTHAKSSYTEEPCEVKVSRTVLEPSQMGRPSGLGNV